MPTLLLKGMFSFYKDAIVSESLVNHSKALSAIQMILKIIEIKMQGHRRIDHVYLLNARTGSGKSTLMIASIFNALAEEHHGKLLCSEPRVVLTKSNALDVIRYHNNFVLGKNIGVLTGSERILCTAHDSLYYCTTQILNDQLVSILQTHDERLAKMKLSAYNVIVIDEVHVLDLPMLGLLKTILNILDRFGEYEACPLFIFASATIDVEQLTKYYFPDDYKDVIRDPTLIGEVLGEPNYKVENIFLDASTMAEYNERENREGGMSGFTIVAEWFVKNCYQKLLESKSYIKVDDKKYQCRDALIFSPLVSGINTIGRYLTDNLKDIPIFYINNDTTEGQFKTWREKNRGKKRVLVVGFARNFSVVSDEILSHTIDPDEEALENETKIVIATPIIETGKTISTLRLCIDIGMQTQTLYNPLVYKMDSQLMYLRQIPINKKQSIQREGRIGREAPGTFVHFYTEDIFNKFALFDTPETINNVYLSNLMMDEFAGANIGDVFDVVNTNKFLYPITTDIFTKTMHDLIHSGLFSIDGKFIDTRRVRETEIWITYARFLYIISGYSLYEALLIAAVNRKTIVPVYNIHDMSSSFFKHDLKSITKESSHEIIDGIRLARNALTVIMYGTRNKYNIPYIEERVYEKRKLPPNTLRSKGGMREVVVQKNDELSSESNDWFP